MRLKKSDGKTSIHLGLICIVPLAFVVAGCFGASHTIHSPDREMFYANIASPNLRAAFDDSRLTPGMPYFIIDQLFAEWKNDRHRFVPGVGSRQELHEEEGWSRVYHDPHIKSCMKEFKTKKGKVTVWYEYPDFYRADVNAGDTLAVFWHDSILTSPICCLLGSRYLSITDSMAGLPSDTFFSAEIRHIDNPRYEITQWYRLEADDPATFYLTPTGFDLYRIELIEIDGEPVDYFQWRTGDEDQ